MPRCTACSDRQPGRPYWPLIATNVPYTRAVKNILGETCYNPGRGQWNCEPLYFAYDEAIRAIEYASRNPSSITVETAKSCHAAFYEAETRSKSASSNPNTNVHRNTTVNPVPSFEQTVHLSNVQRMLDTHRAAHKDFEYEVIVGMMPPGVTADELTVNLQHPDGERLKRLPAYLQNAMNAMIEESEMTLSLLSTNDFARADRDWEALKQMEDWNREARQRGTWLESQVVPGKPRTSWSNLFKRPAAAAAMILSGSVE